MPVSLNKSMEIPQELRDPARVVESVRPPAYRAYLSCNWCGSLENLRRCGRCHRAFYCSKDHQRAHWTTHRQECYARARPEDLQPSNDRGDQFVTAPTTLSNLDYTTTVTGGLRPVETKVPSQVSPQSELDTLLDVSTFDAAQFGSIGGLLPNSIEDNFNNIDLGLLLDDNVSANSSWSKTPSSTFTAETNTCSTSESTTLAQEQFATIQDNNPITSTFTQIPDPPPYKFTENSTYVAANLGSLDINSGSQENSNIMSQSIDPTSTNHADSPQIFLYELSDLTKTENVCRDSFPPDMTPLPEASITPEFLNKVCSNVVHDMNQFGICVIDNFLGKKTGESILSEVKKMYSVGMFEEGQVVSSNHRTITKTIRGDRITWVDGKEENCRFVGFLIHTLDTIVSRCLKMKNSGLFGKCRINRRTKAMIACYPGNGTHYVKHVDNPNQDGRCITTIYYLNQAWNIQQHGGLLRMFPANCDNQVANIEPLFDRILFFWSDRRNPHEVLPAFSVRFAITVWYCNADDRAKAMQRYAEELQKRKSEVQGLKQFNSLSK